MNHLQRGFKLIDMLAILGLVVAITAFLTAYESGPDRADLAKGGLAKIALAVRDYRRDTGLIPPSIHALMSKPDDVPNWKGPYLHASQIIDPWGTEYRYQTPGTGNRPFEVRSLGSDRAAGGSGDAGDLTNWD